jgi:hypothetical protein
MKKLPIFVVILIFIVIFCAGFIGTAKLTIFFLVKRNTQTVENNPSRYFWILVFTGSRVETIPFSELEKFKQQNPNYSFLVPKDKQDYYNEILDRKYEKPSLRFRVEQLSDEKQLISLYSSGSMSDGTDIYEATDKEIFPKTSSEFNMIDALITFALSLIGGTIFCLVFCLFYKKRPAN